jgi:fibronectin-binding autotransporter adhesin
LKAPDQLYFNGINTYTGGTAIGFGSAYPNYFNSIANFNNSNSFGTGTITLTTFGNGSALAAEGSSAITIPNNFTLSANVTNNFVGNAAGITYSGNWTMGANRLTFETGNVAANIDIISGVLSGTGGFAVSDVGTLKLSGVNTYSGNTAIISPAVVTISGAGQLGSGTYAGNITNGGAFTYSSSANQTLSGIISGAGTFTNNGSGALTLSGVNTFTKGLAMNGGTLNINNNAALGTSAGTFTVTGGTIDNTSAGSVTTASLPEAWNGDFAYTGTQPLNLGAGAVTPSANRQITVNGNTLTVGGVIGGAFTLTKAGPGTLALNGVNTFSGGTTISAGTLTIGGAGKLAAAGNVTNNGTFTYAPTATQASPPSTAAR